MKRTTKIEAHPPTSVRVDPDLVHRAKRLALDNRRDKRTEDTFSKIVNAALAAYLGGRRGA